MDRAPTAPSSQPPALAARDRPTLALRAARRLPPHLRVPPGRGRAPRSAPPKGPGRNGECPARRQGLGLIVRAHPRGCPRWSEGGARPPFTPTYNSRLNGLTTSTPEEGPTVFRAPPSPGPKFGIYFLGNFPEEPPPFFSDPSYRNPWGADSALHSPIVVVASAPP